MVKKQVVLIFFLVFNLLGYSQSSRTGEITYLATLNIGNIGGYITKMPKQYNKQVNDILNNNRDVVFYLKFNDDSSIFFKKDRMKNEGTKSNGNLTEIKAGKGLYYTEKKTMEVLHQNEAFGEMFIISNPKTKWELTNESKKIGNYICHKAKTFKTIEGRSGKKNIEVIAWYTLSLPFNFGPKNYNGLPGLIISLQEGNLYFNATKIKINNKTKIEIKRPIRGKKITLKKYNLFVRNLFSNKRKRF